MHTNTYRHSGSHGEESTCSDCQSQSKKNVHLDGFWPNLNTVSRENPDQCTSFHSYHVFIRVHPTFLCSLLHIGYTLDVHTHPHPLTHKHTLYESSFISWLSVLAIFLGGAGLSASPCSCSLFFAAFCLKTKRFRKVSTGKYQVGDFFFLFWEKVIILWQ